MSVILVVEPDSRHAAQLAAMGRRHLTAELVMADSVSHAIAAIADRVPDVLLMSPLMSRQDEATLAAWLRDLGPAAAHVQELTIPILATTPVPVQKRRGVLSGLRRNRGETTATDGCGLDEFARQVSAYVAFAYAYRGITDPAVSSPPPCDVELSPVPSEPDVVLIGAAPVEGVGWDEDGWIPIALDDACAEPWPSPRNWAPIAGNEELFVAAAASSDARPEPNVIATPVPESASPAIAEPEAVVIATPAPAPARATRKRKGRGPRRKPAQDESGLFDPEQCGFAALVAKLNEITDNNHAEQTSAETTVRLIAY